MLASQERIQELCREKGITVRKLEMKLGFSNGYIMTKREREFPTDRLSQIATELGVSVDYLMSGKEEPAAQEQNEKKPATQSGEPAVTVSNRDELIRLIYRLTDQEVSDLLVEVKRIILGQ